MKRREFRWNEWNINHIGQHNISTQMAEYVANRYPARRTGDDRFIVKGQTSGGLYIQVVFVIDSSRWCGLRHSFASAE